MVEIVISRDFSVAPGGRFKKEGPFSGEAFREEFLKPKYDEAIKNKEKLIIDMDGCFGFAPSFLEESFGGLVRIKKDNKILKNIVIKCNDEPGIVKRIEKYIENAL